MTSVYNEAAPFSETALIRSPYYNDSHARLRSFLRNYYETEIFPSAATWEESGDIPAEVILHHASLGLALPGLPARYRRGRPLPGGVLEEEWDIFHDCVLTEESNRCPRIGVIWGLSSGNGIGCPPILHHGTEEQKQEYLPKVYTGEYRFVLGITEPDAGSDVARLRTTATLSLDGTHYIVNGAKKWITNGIWADFMTTAVRTGGPGKGGISALIIPLKSPGVMTRRFYVSGVRASGTTYITLEDVEVPIGNLIGRENYGFQIIMSNFNPERLSLAVGGLRLARTCLAESWQYAQIRETFGKPLISNQVIRRKFSRMVQAVESVQAWLESIVYHMISLEKQRGYRGAANNDTEVGCRLALLKVAAGRALELCVREAQQTFGGIGYTRGEGKGSVVEQISRDARVFVVGGGSEEILEDLAIRLATQASKKEVSESKL